LIAWFDFRIFGCSEREYQRGDEIAWYADGDKIVRNEFNPATAYAFGNFILVFFFLFRFFYLIT
jgi:hypothetical protein